MSVSRGSGGIVRQSRMLRYCHAENIHNDPFASHGERVRSCSPLATMPGRPCAGLVGCPVCAAQWGYSYLDGPPTWGGMCMNGGVQSPIDIRSDILKYARKEDRPRMITNYRKTNVKVIDTGHGTMQVNFPEGSNTLDIGDNKVRWEPRTPRAGSSHGPGRPRSPVVDRS